MNCSLEKKLAYEVVVNEYEDGNKHKLIKK